ncbi:MAG: BlaI/MecI/CopY family transcriptional regulator [Roseburia sp.]|nr:BlaI/MecI/CopY family transcriptional regulator [Roseburia sp.]
MRHVKNKYQLTEREQAVMDLLWRSEEALTSVDIGERLHDVVENATYVHRAINKLLMVGLIKECGSIRYRTQYARRFIPCMTREEYAAQCLIKQGIQAKSIGKLAMALVKETECGKGEERQEVIETLQEIIDRLRAQPEK